MATRHLWEFKHPFFGAEGYVHEAASFAELRDEVDASDENLNHAYRWDWDEYSQPHYDDLFLPGEDRSRQTFTVFLAVQRHSNFWSISCPITHEQESEVLEWLRGPRMLGALRTLWEPLLDPCDLHG